VADVSGHAATATQNAAGGDDSAADPCAHCHIGQIVTADARSEPPLSQRGGNPVVFQSNRQANSFFHHRRERKINEAGDCGRRQCNAAFGVKRSRCADSNADEVD
jgi:hypothetical protein